MTIAILFLLGVLSVAVGAAAIYMAILEPFPLRWLYWHYFVRKLVVWSILLVGASWVAWLTWQVGTFPFWTIAPLGLMAFGVVLAHRMHQEVAFPAIDDPPVAKDPMALPLEDDAEVAVVEHGGVTRAYALDHVIHHHIINDHFGDRLVALTYCAMCRTVIPFDVSDIGPLFVASFKNANMVMADRRTGTFFQQASFESVIGKLHPHTLTMLPFQMLPWREVKRLEPMPEVARVTEHDLREFELPIPGVWRRIMASEATPGLSARRRDRSVPARTRVIGVQETASGSSQAWLKSELMERGVVEIEKGVTLVAVDGVVNAFQSRIAGEDVHLALTPDRRLTDEEGTSRWDLRGKHMDGNLPDLTPVPISDEYWFSWKRFHPDTTLVRQESATR